MSKNSKIQWTHHTFNPWRGCTKISEGCRNCYADEMSNRNPKVLGVWGPNGTRVVAGESMWEEPVKWNREAKQTGERRRVFCASLADVFEDWPGRMVTSKGNPFWWCHGSMSNSPLPSVGLEEGCRFATMGDIRLRLFQLIHDTPHLDWLLLTKRPQNVMGMWNYGHCEEPKISSIPFPPNVWIGTSVENQQAADERIPHLLMIPAKVRFLSMEPLLGPVDIESFGPRCPDDVESSSGHWEACSTPDHCAGCGCTLAEHARTINWVIVGGESGPNARPCNWSWIKSVVEQCQAASVPIFVKQLGAASIVDVGFPAPKWKRSFRAPVVIENGRVIVELADPKGGDPDEWPEDLRVREFPNPEESR